jgi:oligoendopeptidase F
MQTPKTPLATETVLHSLEELEMIIRGVGSSRRLRRTALRADTAKPEYQDLEQRVEQRSTEIRNLLLFFELEWLKLDDAAANHIMANPSLASHKHYLAGLRRYRPSRFHRTGREIVNEQYNTGRNAFGRLFSEVILHSRWKTRAKKKISILARSFVCFPGLCFMSTRLSAKRPRLFRTVKRSRSLSRPLKLSTQNSGELPENFLQKLTAAI